MFTTSSIFTVPKGITEIDIFAVGGGGKGSGHYSRSDDGFSRVADGGGGGGGYTNTQSINVIPGETINISIGDGGKEEIICYNGWDRISNGGDGSNTIISSNGNEIVANAGKGGGDKSTWGNRGGNGGSGGGGGWSSSTGNNLEWAGNGGSDGSDGVEIITNSPYHASNGKGQHTTTRAFGESTGTLYAGGGGGNGYYSGMFGTGGAGGGGNANSAGAINTGGGGGGNLGNGGSGIAIIRWGN